MFQRLAHFLRVTPWFRLSRTWDRSRHHVGSRRQHGSRTYHGTRGLIGSRLRNGSRAPYGHRIMFWLAYLVWVLLFLRLASLLTGLVSTPARVPCSGLDTLRLALYRQVSLPGRLASRSWVSYITRLARASRVSSLYRTRAPNSVSSLSRTRAAPKDHASYPLSRLTCGSRVYFGSRLCDGPPFHHGSRPSLRVFAFPAARVKANGPRAPLRLASPGQTSHYIRLALS